MYYKKARYKVYWGGRGAAKSRGFAEALIRLAAEKPLRILCAREYQNSIKDSSHKLLKDTIERLGLSNWFTVTQDAIRSKTGSEFMFKGLHNNENGIRSTEGVDIVWVEEAHSVSEKSWQSLLPTIRNDDAEIWISFNLVSEEDATYQRFVAKQRSNSIVHKINFDSNPYLPAVLRQEMEDDKANDYHLYEHIWLGMPLTISNSIIFSGKYQVREFEDDLWQQAERLYLGADFGYAQDPATLIRSFILEEHKWPGEEIARRRLFIEYEAYETGIDLDDYVEFYDRVPGSRDWHIKSDSSRPEMPNFAGRRGFAMSAAEKWPGSVEDGITHLRGFHQIVIHPRCTNTAREFRLYSYKVDKNQVDAKGQPLILPVIVDKHNHAIDAIRYSLDGYIQRSGSVGMWARLAEGAVKQE